jgi:putative SbcD/Mre11-related phosphoesterase
MHVLDDWLLTPARAAIHLPSATAVVADLHLGYGEMRCRRGDAVPLASLAVSLAPLTALLARQRIARLIVAGDLFEARPTEAVVAQLQAWLAENGIELVGVVPGNHDRWLEDMPDFRALCAPGVVLGRWRIVHGDGELPAGPLVHGHEHPCVAWPGGVRAPCFLVGKDHLVLPAFSTDAAGVNVRGVERWVAYRCCALAPDAVLDFGPVGALPVRK